MNFPVVASAPQFYQTVHAHVNPPVQYFTPSAMGQCHCHRACPACARCREGNTVLLPCAACHIHPSSPAFPCLSLCYGECTAISGSDFWLFPGFCFFVHILFIFPPCIRCLQVFLLWAVKRAWAWNAWWWWHLGFFMLVFAWATLCMKVELMSQEERGGICEPSCIATMGAPGSHRKTVLEDAPNPLCAKLLPIPGQVYLRDAEEERAWMFLDDEDFCILSARYLS